MKKATLLIEPRLSFDWYPDRLDSVNVSPIRTAINCHADLCSFMFCLPTKPETSGFTNYLWEFLNSGHISLDELLGVARRTNRISSYVHSDALMNIQLSVEFFENRNPRPIGVLITAIQRITGTVVGTSFEKKGYE